MERTGAWTTKHVVGVIIAVIGLVLIFSFGARLTDFFVGQEVRNANEVLNSVMGKVDALEDGESNDFLIRGVEGWYLVGFDVGEGEGKCFAENCLCVCSDSSCDDGKICKVVDEKFVFSSHIIWNTTADEELRELTFDCGWFRDSNVYSFIIDKSEPLETKILLEYGERKGDEGFEITRVLKNGKC